MKKSKKKFYFYVYHGHFLPTILGPYSSKNEADFRASLFCDLFLTGKDQANFKFSEEN